MTTATPAPGDPETGLALRMPANDPARVEALEALRCGFYGGDLEAAVATGEDILASIDPATLDVQQQSTRARTLLWLVRCARRSDALDTALSRAAAGVGAARIAHDARLECQLQAQYVHVLTSLGQNETALEAGYAILRRAVDSGDTLAQAACWLALGQVHWTMQQWRDGDAAYNHALTLARACDAKEICGLASNGIAAMEDHYATEARAAGRVDDALLHARRSFALLQDFTRISVEIGDGYNAWIGGYNQASCLFTMGEHQSASDLLDTQLASLDGDRGTRRQLILQVLGAIHLAQGRHALAISCQTEALEIAERLQVPMLAMDACSALVDALEADGQPQAALVQHRRFHAFYVQLASNRAQAHARAMAVMYETERTQVFAETQRRRADTLASANTSLVQEKEILERSSLEDALTGLANRRRFDQAMETDGVPADGALAMIDVDHFKRINDGFSHLVGDRVLQRLGALLRQCCRRRDLAVRYGGEEFALVLADVDRVMARGTCERLRRAVEAEPWSTIHAGLQVTVSVGLVHADEADFDDQLAIADARLYAAKRGGRNRVVDGSD